MHSGEVVKKGVKLENLTDFLLKQSINVSIGYPLHARQYAKFFSKSGKQIRKDFKEVLDFLGVHLKPKATVKAFYKRNIYRSETM